MSPFSPDDVARDDLAAMTALLKGQMAAIESYSQTMPKFDNSTLVADLEAIREYHVHAASLLQEKVTQLGGPPVESPGAWCACAAAASEATLCPATALAALLQGEEMEMNEFESTLEDENMNPDFKNLIRTKLLPTSRSHVADLDRLMGGGGGQELGMGVA